MSNISSQREALLVLKKVLTTKISTIPVDVVDREKLFKEMRELDGLIAKLSIATSVPQKYSQRFLLLTNYIIDNFEGGFSNDKSDPGGATIYGLSARFHPSIRSKIESGKLTKKEAIDVYFVEYYQRILGIEEINPAIAAIVYDSIIHGSKESIEDIQRYIQIHFDPSIKVDGSYGKATFNAVKALKMNEVADLLTYLITNLSSAADKAGDRVDRYQIKNGLERRNYDGPFVTRLVGRYSLASSLITV